jgi:hypothetical protein
MKTWRQRENNRTEWAFVVKGAKVLARPQRKE